MTKDEYPALLYKPEPSDWNEIARPAEEMQRIVTCVRAIQQFQVAEHFNASVDIVAYPQYAYCIAYPLGLHHIQSHIFDGFLASSAQTLLN